MRVKSCSEDSHTVPWTEKKMYVIWLLSYLTFPSLQTSSQQRHLLRHLRLLNGEVGCWFGGVLGGGGIVALATESVSPTPLVFIFLMYYFWHSQTIHRLWPRTLRPIFQDYSRDRILFCYLPLHIPETLSGYFNSKLEKPEQLGGLLQ